MGVVLSLCLSNETEKVLNFIITLHCTNSTDQKRVQTSGTISSHSSANHQTSTARGVVKFHVNI
jgi:hypothetical protein